MSPAMLNDRKQTPDKDMHQDTQHKNDTVDNPILLPGGGYDLALVASMPSPWAVLVGAHITHRQRQASPTFVVQNHPATSEIESEEQHRQLFANLIGNLRASALPRRRLYGLADPETEERRRLHAELMEGSWPDPDPAQTATLPITRPTHEELVAFASRSLAPDPNLAPFDEDPGYDGGDEDGHTSDSGSSEYYLGGGDFDSDDFDSDPDSNPGSLFDVEPTGNDSFASYQQPGQNLTDSTSESSSDSDDAGSQGSTESDSNAAGPGSQGPKSDSRSSGSDSESSAFGLDGFETSSEGSSSSSDSDDQRDDGQLTGDYDDATIRDILRGSDGGNKRY